MTAQQFVLELGRAMHALGSPSYRVEDTMQACGRTLGLDGAFFSTPTAIFASLAPIGQEAKTTLMRVLPGDHHLGKLAELYAIRDRVVRGECPPERGLLMVREVLARPERGGGVRDVLAHVLAGAGAAPLFGGGAKEVLGAAAAGLVVGALAWLARRRPRFADVVAPLACALAAFLLHTAAAFGLGVDPVIATVAAIVVLLPGFSFTTALAELAMRHLAAGSARLLGTLATLLTMVVGVGLGDRMAAMLHAPVPPPLLVPLAWPWQIAALAATWLAFTILLGATRRQTGWVLLAIAFGYGGARLGGELLGSELGAFLAALVVAGAANLFARFRRQPAATLRTPGLLLLVPGSLGFQGLRTAVTGDYAASVPLLLHMLVVGGAIVAGLLMAGVVVPPPLDVEPDSRAHHAGQ